MLELGAIGDTLNLLGGLLESRSQPFEIVVMGGSALLLLGLIERPTRDLDVLAVVRQGALVTSQPLPPELAQAARDVAEQLSLPPDWLNGAPTMQLDLGLPEGFEQRLETYYFHALTVQVASRLDQIHFKLHAAVDHWPSPSKHLEDLRRLSPTADELLLAARWVREQDLNDVEFPAAIAAALHSFGVVYAG